MGKAWLRFESIVVGVNEKNIKDKFAPHMNQLSNAILKLELNDFKIKTDISFATDEEIKIQSFIDVRKK